MREAHMPIYEYHCVICGETFSRREHISEHANQHPKCPKCDSDRVEQHYGSVFVKTARKS
jgi:putative FmdB family regulatory protein